MAIRRTTVREELLYHYAILIADAMHESKDSTEKHRYWGFVTSRYRALMVGAIKPGNILRQNLQLVENAEQCSYCGSSRRLQWDHIIPTARGGPDTIDNVVRACAACNQRKSDRPVSDWAKIESRPLSRLVRGKHLKLLLDAHRVRGTLEHALASLPDARTKRARIELAVFPSVNRTV